MRLRWGIVASALALLVAACGDAAVTVSTAAPVEITTTTTAPPSTGTVPVTTSTVPPAAGTPVRGQLDWVLAALSGVAVTDEDVAGRFNQAFREQVPDDQLVQIFDQIAGGFAGQPVGVVDVLGETDLEAVVIVGRAGSEDLLEVQIVVEAASPHQIAALLFRPPGPAELEDPPETFVEVAEQLAAEARSTGLIAAEVVDGTCVPIHAARADDYFAIGSTFKLYVLGALAAAVEGGEVAWDDVLAIREDLKSLPSGTMQDEETGTTFTVEEFAKLMISISDNTATDHLIDLVGRDAVEAAQSTLGHGDPARNVPFLTTAELFLLKLALSDEEIDAYLARDAAGRLAFLEGDLRANGLDEVDLTRFSSPVRIDTLEWFATPNEMCAALATLHDLSARPGLEPIRGILETEAATLGIDPAGWSWFGFKGGSEPGVLVLAVIAERDDGRTFVGVIALNDQEQFVDERVAVLLGAAAFRLLSAAA